MKKFFLGLLLTTSLFPYWKERTEVLKGNKVKKGEITLCELLPEQSIFFSMKKSGSVKLAVESPKEEGTLLMFKNGERYKEYRIKEKEEIKLFLRKGEYKLTSQKGALYLRFYEWKERNLSSLQPVGGGFPLTLVIKDKEYAYYKATPDTPCVFKIKGPEVFYLYVRGNFGKKGKRLYKEFVINVYDGEELILQKKFKGKPSKLSTYLERKDIIPGEAEKFKIKLGKGVHNLKVLMEKGKGRVKGYINEKSKKDKLKMGLNMGSGYDSNVFNLSSRDIDFFLKGDRLYKFKDIKTIDDAFFKLEPFIIYSSPGISLFLKGKLKVFCRNFFKNYGNIYLSLSFKNRAEPGFSLFYEPYYFLGPVYITDKNLTYPLYFSLIRGSFRAQFSNISYNPEFETGVEFYNFSPSPQWDYLDAMKYFIGIEEKIAAGKILFIPSFYLYYTDPIGNVYKKDWSNISFEPGFRVKKFPFSLGFEFEFRRFLTSDSLDPIHFSRRDYRITLRGELEVGIEHFKIFPFLEYNQRIVSSSLSYNLTELLKEYRNFSFGFEVRIF